MNRTKCWLEWTLRVCHSLTSGQYIQINKSLFALPGDSLSFLIHHLSLPSSYHIQTRLHSELISAFPLSTRARSELPPFFFTCAAEETEPGTSAECYLQFLQTVTLLPYLDGVIKETLRLYTAIPLTLPRVVPGNAGGPGKVIDGVLLPPGTIVGTCAYAIHRDTETFGDDVFDPERWIDTRKNSPNSEIITANGSNKSAGPRIPVNQRNGEDDGRKRESIEAARTQTVRKMESRLWAFGSGGRGCVGRQWVPFFASMNWPVLNHQLQTVWLRWK